MNATMVSDIFQDTVHHSDDAAFASDVLWRARVAGGIFKCHDDRVADFELAVH
jgi:hypothetical protein